MKVVVDHITNKDESYSKTGLPDFAKPESGDVRTLPSKSQPPRTRNPRNNSY